MKVTFQEAYETFVENGTEESRRLYNEWSTRTDLVSAGVVDFVQNFTFEAIFDISRLDFDAVAERTQHALGTVKPECPLDAKGIAQVEGLSTPWSFMQIFHGYIRDHGRIPLWQEFWKFLQLEASDNLWTPYCNKLNLVFEQGDPDMEYALLRGIRWRLGNAYYSALRELDVLISLRDMGMELKYHVLVDALYAVDFWHQEKLVSIYIPNAKFKDDGHGGRKARPDTIFAGSNFYFDDFVIDKRKKHGEYWPVTEMTTSAIADFVSGRTPSKRMPRISRS